MILGELAASLYEEVESIAEMEDYNSLEGSRNLSVALLQVIKRLKEFILINLKKKTK